jgi:hypothetical protein
LEVPASPTPIAFIGFDSTTGLLAPGSWGATVVVTLADQNFLINAGFGQSGPSLPGDAYADVHFSTVDGAGFRQAIETWTGGDVRVRIVDAAGVLALLPANSRVFVSVYRRNSSIG